MCYYRLGDFDAAKAGHDENYFVERHCTIDYRGDLKISPLSYFGFGVHVVTLTHVLTGGAFTGYVKNIPVVVDDYAWVTSYSVLYNCHIKHHGIVSIGSVVKDMTVEPYTIVSGNPAVPVAHWNGEKWVRLV